jgi:glucose/arabinose dehydrogenase
MAFGPDGLLYVPVGAPCNICDSDENRYALIMRMKADGTGTGVFARGIRNTVGFDWHPVTKELWFTGQWGR